VKKDKRQKLQRALRAAAICFLVAAPLLFMIPQTTHAAFFGLLPDLSPGGITAAVFRILAFILNFIFGLLFILGGALVNMMMHLNANILNQENALVGIGWTISRDVANLGFVLVMIIVAVATIVRYEKFSAKSLLPKLIGAAIIVNFSLTIAGVFITFSNSLTNVFLNGKMSGDMVGAIDNAFGPQKLLLPPENPPPPDPSQQGSAAGGVTAAILTSIAGLVFTTLFTALAAFVLLVFAFMLMIRYVYLSFLLIVAPLVWLFWVFPPLNKLFGEWWSKFLDWVFFAPAVTFFIYIALTSAKFLGSVSISTSGSVGSILETTFSQGAQMVIMGGIMIGGLIAAKSMGIAGAGAAIKLAQGAGNKAKAWASKTSQRLATAPLRTQTGRKFVGGMQKFGQNLPPVLKQIAAPITGQVRIAGNALAQQRAKAEKQVADAGKKLPKNLKEQAQQYASADNPKRVAIASNLLKEKDKRKKAADTARNKVTNANLAVSNAQENLKQAERSGDLSKSREARQALAEAEAKRNDAISSAQQAIEAEADMMEIMAQLPKNARAEFERAEIEMKSKRGEKFKGSPLAFTRLGRQYGQTDKSYFATEGKTEKVEAAIKAVQEEGGEEGEGSATPKPAGGGGGKK
jgi:hypothetical protein